MKSEYEEGFKGCPLVKWCIAISLFAVFLAVIACMTCKSDHDTQPFLFCQSSLRTCQQTNTTEFGEEETAFKIGEIGIDGNQMHVRNPVVVTNIGFTLCYDTFYRTPSWVQYDMCPSRVVKAERKSVSFKPDPRIELDHPEGLAKGYKAAMKCGWDRGHMVPAADMNWDTNALKQTYYFSNVCPMARHVNRGEWLRTEEEVRRLAQSGTVHVVMFPLYHNGILRCAVGPIGRCEFPDSFVKVAWGYFGVRYWRVENARNGKDTELKDPNQPWLGCVVEDDGEEQVN